MNGWRRGLIGELCAGWLRGELAIVTDGVNSPDGGAAAPSGDATAGSASIDRSSVRLVPRATTVEPA
jgi:hypothetical protein